MANDNKPTKTKSFSFDIQKLTSYITVGTVILSIISYGIAYFLLNSYLDSMNRSDLFEEFFNFNFFLPLFVVLVYKIILIICLFLPFFNLLRIQSYKININHLSPDYEKYLLVNKKNKLNQAIHITFSLTLYFLYIFSCASNIKLEYYLELSVFFTLCNYYILFMFNVQPKGKVKLLINGKILLFLLLMLLLWIFYIIYLNFEEYDYLKLFFIFNFFFFISIYSYKMFDSFLVIIILIIPIIVILLIISITFELSLEIIRTPKILHEYLYLCFYFIIFISILQNIFDKNKPITINQFGYLDKNKFIPKIISIFLLITIIPLLFFSFMNTSINTNNLNKLFNYDNKKYTAYFNCNNYPINYFKNDIWSLEKNFRTDNCAIIGQKRLVLGKSVLFCPVDASTENTLTDSCIRLDSDKVIFKKIKNDNIQPNTKNSE